MTYAVIKHSNNKELIFNLDARKQHIMEYLLTHITLPENTEIDTLDLCDSDGNLVELKTLPTFTSCIELENVLSIPYKEWFLVVRDEVEIKPILDKEFWPNKFADKLAAMRIQAIKNRDRKLKQEQSRGSRQSGVKKSKTNISDDQRSTSSRNTTSRKSTRVR